MDTTTTAGAHRGTKGEVIRDIHMILPKETKQLHRDEASYWARNSTWALLLLTNSHYMCLETELGDSLLTINLHTIQESIGWQCMDLRMVRCTCLTLLAGTPETFTDPGCDGWWIS